MEAIFLGTGTSQGIPVIGCKCSVCKSENSKDKRLRTSLYIKSKEFSIVIDAGPDFRQQILRENISKLDAVLFTHAHKDHTGGLDDVRAFNYLTKMPMDVFADKYTIEGLKKEYYYIFDNYDYPGIPKVKINLIDNNDFYFNNQLIAPIRALHHKLPVLGYRIGDLTYLTDANYISQKEMEKISGSKILVLNALRKEKHISHFNLNEALKIAEIVNAEQTYFTHISHLMGLYDDVQKELPKSVALAYDGLKLLF